MKLVKLPTAFQ